VRADNSHHLVAAAQRRAEETLDRAVTALRRMNAAGKPITFDAVAHEARVSRSWLYTQDHIRAEIEGCADGGARRIRVRTCQTASVLRTLPSSETGGGH
jgi:hypothetical protein